MADVIVALVICVPFFLLGVAACWDKWQEYHSPLGAALRERQQKKERRESRIRVGNPARA